MTFEEFDKYQHALLQEVKNMSGTKGKEYAHDADRFANFNRLGEGLGLPNVMIGWVYTKKHLDAIASYIKEGREFSSEGIRGRLVDAITYLTLIGGMIEETKTIIPVVSKEVVVDNKTVVVANNLDGVRCVICLEEFQVGNNIFKRLDGYAHYDRCPMK